MTSCGGGDDDCGGDGDGDRFRNGLAGFLRGSRGGESMTFVELVKSTTTGLSLDFLRGGVRERFRFGGDRFFPRCCRPSRSLIRDDGGGDLAADRNRFEFFSFCLSICALFRFGPFFCLPFSLSFSARSFTTVNVIVLHGETGKRSASFRNDVLSVFFATCCCLGFIPPRL